MSYETHTNHMTLLTMFQSASPKGIYAGPATSDHEVKLIRGNESVSCSDLESVKWILVVEKEVSSYVFIRQSLMVWYRQPSIL